MKPNSDTDSMNNVDGDAVVVNTDGYDNNDDDVLICVTMHLKSGADDDDVCDNALSQTSSPLMVTIIMFSGDNINNVDTSIVQLETGDTPCTEQ